MKTFADNLNRKWEITLTIGSVKRVMGLLPGVNLLELDKGDPPLLTRLATDVTLLCDIIYALVKPQADKAGCSDEDFGAALGGDVILRAQEAFYEEIVLFFQALKRADLVKALEIQKAVVEKAVERTVDQIEKIDLDEALEEAFGKISTTVPESSESTPTP